MLFLLNLECCSFCSSHQYYSPMNGCLECNSNCATCLGPNPNYCSSCYAGYFIYSFSCYLCENNCIKCFNSNKCESCKDGYYLSSGTCSKCIQPCKTCSDKNTCESCIDKYFLLSGKSM